jgi:hypothetical protein
MTFENIITKNMGFIQIAVVIIIVILIIYFSKRMSESMTNQNWLKSSPFTSTPVPIITSECNTATPANMLHVEAAPEHDSDISPVHFSVSSEQLMASDLLPKSSVASEFSGGFNGVDLSASNFLTSGFSAGINTQGNSNKNPNFSIRSDPYIPTNQNLGPWQMSTILPDNNRKTFEIGM